MNKSVDALVEDPDIIGTYVSGIYGSETKHLRIFDQNWKICNENTRQFLRKTGQNFSKMKFRPTSEFDQNLIKIWTYIIQNKPKVETIDHVWWKISQNCTKT